MQQQLFVRAVQDEDVNEKFFPTSEAGPSPVDLSHLSQAQQKDVRPLLNPELFRDVVIFSQSWEEYVSHLQAVLSSIQAAGLTINPQKCAIAQKEVQYLGFVIGFGKIKPQLGKVEAIHAFPVPTTKKKVRGFVGLVGWYRKFVPHFADRSAVLNDLTKASAPNKVRWTDECDRAFKDL